MATGTPDNKNVTPNEETLEALGAKRTEKGKRTPDSTLNELNGLEDQTLDTLRERDRGFWKRVGRMGAYAVPFMEGANPTEFGDYKMKIRGLARDEARDLLDGMGDLSDSTSKRLRWYSRKSAERYANITSRINVSNRTLGALKKHRELVKEEIPDLRGIADGVRMQAKSDQPVRTGIRLVAARLKPRSKDLNALGAKSDLKLASAAKEVGKEAKAQKIAFDQKIENRLRGARKAENHLRNILLRHDPSLTDTIEERLRACAAGPPDDQKLRDTIDSLAIKGLNAKQQKEVRATLHVAADTLSGKSGGMSKVFEMAGRLEMTGNTTEVVNQIRSMPLGTQLRVFAPEFTSEVDHAEEMVLHSKKPADTIVLRPKGGGRLIAIDYKKKAAWQQADRKTTEAKEADQVMRKVLALANTTKALQSKPDVLKDLRKAIRDAMMDKDASDATVRQAAENAVPKNFVGRPALLKLVADSSKEVLDHSTRDADKAPEHKEGVARTLDFNKLQFFYPEQFAQVQAAA